MIQKNLKNLVIGLSFLATTFCIAEINKGISFTHQDWEIACDNTGTCRIAGYGPDDGSQGVSVLLTRKAGPKTTVKGHLKLASYDDHLEPDNFNDTSVLSLHIDEKNLGNLIKKNEVYILKNDQVMALIKSLSKDSKIVIKSKEKTWPLSDKGGVAVLLKADEYQKRIGTNGALIKKGGADESKVLKETPIPVHQAPEIPEGSDAGIEINTMQSAKLLIALRKTLSQDEDDDYCPKIREQSKNPPSLFKYQLDKKFSLLSAFCWTGAYNGGSGFWLIDSEFKNKPKLITFSASDYHKGIISENHKGRGLGDCWSGTTRVWNGKDFVISSKYTTGMCRLIEAGGAWMLPTVVSKVK